MGDVCFIVSRIASLLISTVNQADMSDTDSITELQTQLAHLERHITEQDAEFYQLAKRVDALSKLVKMQKVQIETLAERGSTGAGDMPADEKPPHY